MGWCWFHSPGNSTGVQLEKHAATWDNWVWASIYRPSLANVSSAVRVADIREPATQSSSALTATAPDEIRTEGELVRGYRAPDPATGRGSVGHLSSPTCDRWWLPAGTGSHPNSVSQPNASLGPTTRGDARRNAGNPLDRHPEATPTLRPYLCSSSVLDVPLDTDVGVGHGDRPPRNLWQEPGRPSLIDVRGRLMLPRWS